MAEQGKGLFVDVRTVGEVLEEQVPDSVFLPFDLVSKERLDGLGGRDKTPILVCRTGRRATEAAQALSRQRDDVAVLDGGIVRWKDDGLPVTQGNKTIPLERQVLVAAGTMIFLFTLLGLAVSPYFFAATVFMAGGMVFAGVTGACGMARILTMMPWNKAPLCTESCSPAE